MDFPASVEVLESRRLFATGGLSYGDLDPTFGTGGRGTVQFGQRSVDTAYATIAQPDGKIIVVGSTNALDGNGTDLAVARLNPDLTLDQSFGETTTGELGGGLYEVSLPTNDDSFYGVDLQPDGKIVVVGSVSDYDNATETSNLRQAIIIRLKADGSPDETFGTGLSNGGVGFVFLPFSTNLFTGLPNSEARAVGVQSDGKIVIGGAADLYDATVLFPATSSFAVARLNTNGELDPTFGESGTGVDVEGDASLYGFILGLDVDRQDRIVFTGTAIFQDTVGVSTGIFLTARTTKDGLPDYSFGTEGVVTTLFSGSGLETVLALGTSVVVQPDGKILVAGLVGRQDFFGNGYSNIGLVRLDEFGNPDPSFGGLTGVPGVVETLFQYTDGSYETLTATQIRLDPTGGFFVSGKAGSNADGSIVARYLSNGDLDTRFSDDGVILLFPTFSPSSTNGNPFSNQAVTTLASGSLTDQGTSAGAFVEQPAGGGILILATGAGGVLTVARLVPDGADLISSFTVNKPTIVYLGGAKGSGVVKVSNQGSAVFSGSVPVRVSISTDSSVATSDQPFFTKQLSVSLKPGQSKTFPLSFAYPKGAGIDGDFFVIAVINPDNVGSEGNTVNNAGVSAGTIKIRRAFVDIAANFGAAPAGAVQVGKKGSFSIEVTNNGTIASKGKITLQLFASTDDAFGNDTLLAGSAAVVLNLKPGKKLLKISGAIPRDLVPNSYILLLRLDATGVSDVTPVREINTGKTLTVTA